MPLSEIAIRRKARALLCSPEQKLPIEIRHINGVHVDDVYVAETAQREIGEDLAAQAACTDDEHLALRPQERLCAMEDEHTIVSRRASQGHVCGCNNE